MAQETLAEVALLSIHPTFADAILEGRKKVEFRRRPFGRPVNYILVYATSPISALVGFFKVSRVVADSPRALWERYSEVGCIEEPRFLQYYEGCESAVAISVKSPVAFEKPIDLAVLGLGVVPPQSYRYITREIFDLAVKRAQSDDPA